MLENLLRRADVREFLYEVLTDDRFGKISPEMNGEKSYPEKEYGLLLAMDAIIKYSILFDFDDLIDEYVAQLRRFMKKCENQHDFEEGVHRLLGKITAVTLKIEEEQMEEVDSKRKILSYIYNRYITEGYLFYAFPERDSFQIMERGLDRKENLPFLENFEILNQKEPGFLKEEDPFFLLTDSPLLAYHRALMAPFSLANLTSLSPWMKNEKKYDRGAYFRRDFKKAKENMEQLCLDFNLSNQESKKVLTAFLEEWKNFQVTDSKITFSFIKRKSVDQNYLKDYRKILEMAEKEDLSYLIGQILETRIEDFKRYTPIAREDIEIVHLPNYQEMTHSNIDYQEEIPNEKEQEEIEENINLRMEVANAYGSASALALLGILLIALGVIVTIIFAMYKG